jgi:hypothetical protein
MLQAGLGINGDTGSQITKAKKGWECGLSSKCEALSSIPRVTKLIKIK